MLRDFIAIDFETANQQPSSVCSVGVVMVRDGQIVDSFYSLIQPDPNYYNYWCQRVHGLRANAIPMMHQYSRKYGSNWKDALPMCFSLTNRQSMISATRLRQFHSWLIMPASTKVV